MGSQNSRFAYIDGLRGVAVAGVMLLHARSWGGVDWKALHFLGVGRAGVDLFLALSGFCLFLPLVRQGDGSVRPLDIREYTRRRARRILPPYYAALLIAIVVCYLTYRFSGPSWWTEPFQNLFPVRGLAGLGNVVTHLTLAHGLVNRYAHSIEGSFWSLSLEVQFYTLLPLLVWIARRFSLSWAVAIPVLTSFIYRCALYAYHPVVLSYYIGDEICVSRWAEFGMGMLAAAWAAGAWGGLRTAALKSQSALFVGMLAVLLVTCALELYNSHLYLLPLAWGLAGCLLLVCAGQPGRLRACLEWPPLVRLGTMSYTVYLLHGSVYRLMATVISRYSVPPDIRAALFFLVGVPLTLAVSLPFFRYFELPFFSRRLPNIKTGPQAV